MATGQPYGSSVLTPTWLEGKGLENWAFEVWDSWFSLLLLQLMISAAISAFLHKSLISQEKENQIRQAFR